MDTKKKRKKPLFIMSISAKMFLQTCAMLIFYSTVVILTLQIFTLSIQTSRARNSLSSMAEQIYTMLIEEDENSDGSELRDEIRRLSSANNFQVYIYEYIEGRKNPFFSTGSFGLLEEMETVRNLGTSNGGLFTNKTHKDTMYVSFEKMYEEYLIEILENQTYFQINTENTLQLMRFVVLAGILLALVWSFWYSQYFTRPIKQMNKVALNIANLNFEEKCKIKRRDEMGWLANNINDMSDKLEQAVGELGATNQSLAQRLDRAEQLDEMRKKFISDVSHELKTPISIIAGYAEALERSSTKDNFKEKSLRYIEVISDEAAKMNTLVLDLLDLSSVESGHYVLKKEEFSTLAFIQKCTQKYDDIFQREGIELVLDIEDALVSGDLFRLTQVLDNLIGNAIHHLSGKKVITIMGLSISDAKYRISVKNSGEPIAPEACERIFESFFRGDNSRNRNMGRHGIGLSIVKALVELHGGSVGVRNLDSGVEFFFIF